MNDEERFEVVGPGDDDDASRAGDARPGDVLRGPEASSKVVRGGAVRTAGYAVGTLANIIGSVLLLRYLGVAQFGSYVAVTSLVAIAGGIADGGLTAVGNRELALLHTNDGRKAMVSRLLGMRLVITPLAVLVAVLFAVLSGYPGDLVLGTALAGVGWTCVAASASLAMPLSVDLRIVSLTALDVVKQVGAAAVIVGRRRGAGLLPFFAATIPAALLALAITPLLLPNGSLGRPTFRFRGGASRVRRSLPIAFATVVGAVYLRFLTVLVFQFSTETETGLFGTSARILEAISGLPLLIFLIALPVMSLSFKEDPDRMRVFFQRMVEVGTLLSWSLITVLLLGARPIILLVGGEQYLGAVPVLRVQSFALAGSLLAMSCLMAAIAMDLDRSILAANGVALLAVVVFGVPMVVLWQAEGAAAATVLGDAAMGLSYWFLLGRAGRSMRPHLGHVWKSVLATVLAVAVAGASGTHGLVAPALGLGVFLVVVTLTRAIPPQVLDAVWRTRSRRPIT